MVVFADVFVEINRHTKNNRRFNNNITYGFIGVGYNHKCKLKRLVLRLKYKNHYEVRSKPVK